MRLLAFMAAMSVGDPSGRTARAVVTGRRPAPGRDPLVRRFRLGPAVTRLDQRRLPAGRRGAGPKGRRMSVTAERPVHATRAANRVPRTAIPPSALRHAGGQPRPPPRPGSTASRSSSRTSSRRRRPRRSPRTLRGPRALDRSLPALPRLRLHRSRAARGQPAPGRAQVRRHGGARHGPDPGVPSVSPDAVDDDGRIAEQLHVLAERAAARGVRVSYEALAWGRHVNTYDGRGRSCAVPTTRRWGCASTASTSSPAAAAPPASATSRRAVLLQLADAPHMDMNVLQWSRHHRLFPGQAPSTCRVLGHVLVAGYTGPLSLEVFNDVFRQADPRRAAVDALRSLLALDEAVHATWPTTRRGAPGERPRPRPRRGAGRCPTPRSCAASRSPSGGRRRMPRPDRPHPRGARLHPRRRPSRQARRAVVAGRAR